MRRTFLRAALMAGATLTASALPSGSATAHDFRAGDLQIGHPWTRAVTASAPTAAGYMTIRNTGSVADRLVGAEMSRVNKVEQHEMTLTDGIMRMRPIPGGIAIPPGQEVRLAPGSQHLMLVGPQGGFAVGGDRFDRGEDRLHGGDAAALGAAGRARSRQASGPHERGAGSDQGAGAGGPRAAPGQ